MIKMAVGCVWWVNHVTGGPFPWAPRGPDPKPTFSISREHSNNLQY